MVAPDADPDPWLEAGLFIGAKFGFGGTCGGILSWLEPGGPPGWF